MAQIYKKILRAKGNRGKKNASPPNPSPNGEGLGGEATTAPSAFLTTSLIWSHSPLSYILGR